MSTPSAAAYFRALSSDYDRQTGRSTYSIIHNFLAKQDLQLSSSARVHDNASGPGTATTALLALHPAAPQITATDISAPMIDVLRARIASEGWSTVEAEVADSAALPFPAGHFDLSVTNISVANFRDPQTCLAEIRRCLKPGGLAVVTAWKRFAAADLIHAAQRAVRPDATLMAIPRAEFMGAGYLAAQVVGAGFAKDDVKEDVEVALVTGEDIEGLRGFMLGAFTDPARKGWTEAQVADWPAAIERAIELEVERYGGIRFEAWVVTARR